MANKCDACGQHGVTKKVEVNGGELWNLCMDGCKKSEGFQSNMNHKPFTDDDLKNFKKEIRLGAWGPRDAALVARLEAAETCCKWLAVHDDLSDVEYDNIAVWHKAAGKNKDHLRGL